MRSKGMLSGRWAPRLRALLVLAVFIGALHAGEAAADPVPMNVVMTAGDTLFVRFALVDPSAVPVGYNSMNIDFDFSSAIHNVNWESSVYNDTDTAVGTFGPQFHALILGIGPTFVDTALGGTCCGGSRVPADLSSYADGTGMASFTLNSGPDEGSVLINEFDARWGFASGSSGSSFYIPFRFTFALNSPPGVVVPEPTSLALMGVGLAGLAGYGWRRRKRAA